MGKILPPTPPLSLQGNTSDCFSLSAIFCSEQAKCKYSYFRPVSSSSITEEDGLSKEGQGDQEDIGDGGRSQEGTVEELISEDQEEGQEQVFEEGDIDKEEKERTGPGSLSLTPDIVKGRGDEEEEASPRTPGIATTSRLPDMLDHTPHSLGEPDR